MNTSFLRSALLGDAIFETICALIFILGAVPLTVWLGWNGSEVLTITGGVLVLVALLLYWIATRVQIDLRLTRIIMLLNAIFALSEAVAVIVLGTSLTDRCRLLVGVISLLVGLFAVLEYQGLRLLRSAA